MKFSVFSALVLTTAPSEIQAWTLGPLLFPADRLLLQTPDSMLARQRALANRMFQQTDELFHNAKFSSPRYELIDDETKFKLSVDVPGVKMEDIDISLEDGYLSVKGHREVAVDDENSKSKFSSKFSQTFALDPAVEVDQFSATLDNGVLVVTAPKDMKKLEENIKKIPIMAGSSNVIAESPAMEAAADVKDDDEDKIDLDNVDEVKAELKKEEVVKEE